MDGWMDGRTMGEGCGWLRACAIDRGEGPQRVLEHLGGCIDAKRMELEPIITSDGLENQMDGRIELRGGTEGGGVGEEGGKGESLRHKQKMKGRREESL
jgi:hypothetical protein